MSGLHQATSSPVEKSYITTIWHELLGHPGESAIKAAANIYRSRPENAISCDFCQKGKAAQIINRVATRTGGDVLGQLHADMVGPFRTTIIENFCFT